MTEIIQFPGGLDTPRDFVDSKGDVRFIDDDPDLSTDASDLKDALEARDGEYTVEDPDMPRELCDFLADIEERIEQLRSYGAHDTEIKKKLTHEYGARLARLGREGVDISAAPLHIFAVDSNDTEYNDEAAVIPLSVENERERKIQDYMDKRGVSRAEAEQLV